MLLRVAVLGAVAVLAFAVPFSIPSHGKAPDLKQATATPLLRGLDFPADIDVAPDGSVWFVELKGNVSRLEVSTGERTIERQVENVVTGMERGLVGLALAKDFGTTGDYFLYYTQRNDDPDGGTNRLVRIDDGQETLLLTVPGYAEHNGGRIVVDPDGNLFVGTGENQKRDPAQDMDSNLGKILHMTPDGQPVPGNMQGLIYAKGIRNPYGLVYNEDTGELWETENSGWRRDEVNIIQAGGNYGYPECEGRNLNGLPGPPEQNPCPTDKGYTMPIMTFYEDRAVAPTGAAFWRGEFYWASLNDGNIHHIWKAADGSWTDEVVFTHGPPVLDLDVGYDDALYFSSVEGIYRIDVPLTPGETVTPGDDPDDTTTSKPRTSKEGTSKAAPEVVLGLGFAVVAFVAALRRRA